MNKFMFFSIIAALAWAATARADQLHTICTPNPTVCTSFSPTDGGRFDPLVQHLLVRQQLNQLPTDWQITQFYVPYQRDTRALEEMLIRYLDQLRREAEQEASEQQD